MDALTLLLRGWADASRILTKSISCTHILQYYDKTTGHSGISRLGIPAKLRDSRHENRVIFAYDAPAIRTEPVLQEALAT
ncbi:hypothetical protein BTA51_24710 [Hahella sp. CCB-MM4]|nr:hypothetical protein BTA51_24710 [Hahella sp. CCB-MM4]